MLADFFFQKPIPFSKYIPAVPAQQPYMLLA